MSTPKKELLPSSNEWRAQAVLLGLNDKEWLRSPEAITYSNQRLARLYELHREGEIKSYLLKPHRDAVRGIRLWSRSSIDAYLDRQYEQALVSGNPRAAVACLPKKKEAGA